MDHDYNEDLDVKGSALHYELMRQASLYGKWSEEEAAAEKERDDAKNMLELARSEFKEKLENLRGGLYFKCREQLVAQGVARTTDVMIESRIRSSPDYIEGYKRISAELKAVMDKSTEANYNYNRIHGFVRALDHKNKSMENSVRLYLGGYWSDPHVPHSIMVAINEDARDKQRELLGENKRMRRKLGT